MFTSQHLNTDISELDARPKMMVLQPDVTLQWAIPILEAAYQFAVKLDRNVITFGFDFKRIPLAYRQRSQLGCGSQFVDGTRLVQRIAERVGIDVRVFSCIVDLNLIALVHGELPVIGGIAVSQGRETEKNTRVIVRVGGSPIQLENKVGELLLGIPKQADAIDGFYDVCAKLHKAAEAGHLPAFKSAIAQRAETRFQRQRLFLDRLRRPPCKRQSGQRRICGAQCRENGGTGHIGVGNVVETAVQVGD